MSDKIEQLKKYIQNGQLQLAKLNQKNQPVKMQISQLQKQAQYLNRTKKIAQLVSRLSWQQKYEWVSTRKLKGNQLFKNNSINEAIQTYLQSLIGLQVNNTNFQKNYQVKMDLKFPILLNIASCFYKLKKYQEGIQICDQILDDQFGKQHIQALYKKSYFLLELGEYSKAKQIVLSINSIFIQLQKKGDLKDNKVSKYDLKQLMEKILSKTKEQKNMYRKFFVEDYQYQESKIKPNQDNVLQYQQNVVKKSFVWLKQILENCFRKRNLNQFEVDEQKIILLQNKNK